MEGFHTQVLRMCKETQRSFFLREEMGVAVEAIRDPKD
jgi:hypothetical protein